MRGCSSKPQLLLGSSRLSGANTQLPDVHAGGDGWLPGETVYVTRGLRLRVCFEKRWHHRLYGHVLLGHESLCISLANCANCDNAHYGI